MAAALALLAGLTWGLLRFGATREPDLYGLWIWLTPAVVSGLVLLVRSRCRGASVIVLLTAGALLASAVWLRPTFSARGFTHLCIGWSALLVGYALARSGRRLTMLLFALLIVVGLAEIGYGALQHFDVVEGVLGRQGWGDLASGTLINPNHFAGLVNMTMLLSVGAAVFAFSRSRRDAVERFAIGWLVVALLVADGAAVLASRSRGGLLALLGALFAVSTLMILGRGRADRRRVALSLTVAAAVVAVAAGAILTVAGSPGSEMASLEGSTERLTIYGDSLRLIADHPLVGVSPGMWQWHFRRYQSVTGLSYYEHAHNDYLETAAEWGVPIAALSWGALVWVLWRGSRVYVERRDPWLRAPILGALASTASIVIHSLFDFNLQTPSNLLVFGAVAGALWGLCDMSSPPREAGAEGGRGSRGAVVALTVVVALAWAASAPRVAKRRVAAEVALQPSDLAQLEAALQEVPDHPELHLWLGLALRDGLERHDLAAARTLLERAVALHPTSWRYRLELAWLDELRGDVAAAEAGLEEAIRLNPHSGEYRWRLANLRLRQGRTPAAVRMLGEAVERDWRLAEAGASVALRAGYSWRELAAAWSGLPRAGLRLLQSMCSPGPLAAPESVDVVALWSDLASSARAETDAVAFAPECLARHGLGAQARTLWAEIAAARGLSDPDFASGRNLLWNGDLSLEPTRGGFGWVMTSRADPAVARVIEGGVPTLRISAEKPRRLPVLARTAVALEGSTPLQLEAEVRLTPSLADRLALVVASPGSAEPLLVLPLGASEQGRRVRGVGAAPASSLLELRLERSTTGDQAPLAGTLWLGSVRLH